MADVFSKDKRSEVMSRIRSKDTKPELKIRKSLHRLGFRYRLHDGKLPGRPDLVFPKHLSIIQVRGCFWHGHNCKYFHYPKSRRNYWVPKIDRNRERDKRNDRMLRAMGWRVITVWECKCRTEKSLCQEILRIKRLLDNKHL